MVHNSSNARVSLTVIKIHILLFFFFIVSPGSEFLSFIFFSTIFSPFCVLK